MSPYDVLAAWAVKMAERLEQQRLAADESSSSASRGGEGRVA